MASAKVQRPFAAPVQLGKIKRKLTGVLHDAFEGQVRETFLGLYLIHASCSKNIS